MLGEFVTVLGGFYECVGLSRIEYVCYCVCVCVRERGMGEVWVCVGECLRVWVDVRGCVRSRVNE